MFIKINVRFYGDDRAREYIASNPSDTFYLINCIDKSKKTISWNIEEYKPKDFGWIGPEGWDKYREKLFED